MQDDREKIEMFISCRSLKNMDSFSKSDPQVILYVKGPNGQFTEYGRTEVIQNNLNPNFMKTFTIDYIFEIQQWIKFDVIDYDGPNSFDFIGSCETSISKLMGTKNQTSILEAKGKNNKQNGKLIIRCEKVGTCREILSARVHGEKIADIHTFSKTSPFLKFFRTREDGQLLLIYQTEEINSNLNPIYKPIEIKLSKLCNGDHQLPVRIECWDYQSNGSHNYVGETVFTIADLEQQKKRFELKNPKKKNKASGTICFENFTLIDRPEFIDYIRGGTQLSLICAIDFTGSNGDPRKPTSLHALQSNQQLNQYQSAIVSVGDILINYDYNKLVPTFGFGGKPQLPYFTSNTVLHCFPVNGQPQNPQCAGIQGVLDAYTHLLSNVALSGPTLFNPIIQETMKICQINKDQNTPVYSILMILTDGAIHDMDATISSIIDAAYLPLSIIIIGVGNADFSSMEILDGDQGLFDQQGRKAQRDLVQFVPYNKYKGQSQQLLIKKKGNSTELARNVLFELPDQVVQYYKMIGINPRQAQVIDITAMTGLNEPTEILGKGLAQGGFMQNIVQQGVGEQLQQQQFLQQPQQSQLQQQQQQQQFGGSVYQQQAYPSLSSYAQPQQQQGPYQPTQVQSEGMGQQNPLMMQFGQNMVNQQQYGMPQQGMYPQQNQQGIGLQPQPMGISQQQYGQQPQQQYGQQPQQGIFNQYQQPPQFYQKQ